MTTHEELRKVFVLPLWEKVRPVFLDWIKLRERAEAGEQVRDQFLPTSDGSPLMLAAMESFKSHRDLWGAVQLADADGSWPDLIPLREALEQWALSIHLAGEEWVMLAALNLIWDWWKDNSAQPDVDGELYFGHSDEADWPPDPGDFIFKAWGWRATVNSAETFRTSLEAQFQEQLSRYLQQAEKLMDERGYIPTAFDWNDDALYWFGLFHCGGLSYAKIVPRCNTPPPTQETIRKGVQRIRKTLDVPQRPSSPGRPKSVKRDGKKPDN